MQSVLYRGSCKLLQPAVRSGQGWTQSRDVEVEVEDEELTLGSRGTGVISAHRQQHRHQSKQKPLSGLILIFDF
jgi:hypothetical protein